MQEDKLTELAQKFGLNTDYYDVSDIDPALVRVMRYIDSNTGLLGDYHDGIIKLGEGHRIIQWYGRGKGLSNHSDLLNWIQMEADGVLIAVMRVRAHPETGEPSAYAEIHLAENWGYDDE